MEKKKDGKDECERYEGNMKYRIRYIPVIFLC